MIIPSFLKKGDRIGITAPAKAIPTNINKGIETLKSWGLDVVVGKTVGEKWFQFAGNDELRRNDFQTMLNDSSIKAIIAARGGYGSVRILDQLDFSPLLQNPKWIVGFSDITAIHNHLNQHIGIVSIHGQMPINIPDSQSIALDTLKKALFGEPVVYSFPSHERSSIDSCEGCLIGGNLSLLISMAGSISELDYNNKILFIEDVGEAHYAIDRMLRMLKRSQKLAHLKGLIVGSFTDMKENTQDPFGFSIEEIINEITHEYNYPVFYNFPAGHQSNNQALYLGKTLYIENDGIKTEARYL